MTKLMMFAGAFSLLACGPSPAEPGDTEGSSGSSGGQTTGPTSTGTGEEPTSGGPVTVGTSGTSDASTSDTSSGTTGAPACLEFSSIRHFEETFPPPMFTCELPELCPGAGPLAFSVDQPDIDPGAVSTDDLDRAHCMAAALRDRTPGVIFFQAVYGVLGSHDFALEIAGEQVVARERLINDFNSDYEEAVHTLLPPANFEACVTGTAKSVYVCLIAGFLDDCVTGLECPG